MTRKGTDKKGDEKGDARKGTRKGTDLFIDWKTLTGKPGGKRGTGSILFGMVFAKHVLEAKLGGE